MVFYKDDVNVCWKWCKYSLPIESTNSYLGIDFSSNGAWDMHNYKEGIKDIGTKKANQCHRIISSRNRPRKHRSKHAVGIRDCWRERKLKSREY